MVNEIHIDKKITCFPPAADDDTAGMSPDASNKKKHSLVKVYIDEHFTSMRSVNKKKGQIKMGPSVMRRSVHKLDRVIPTLCKYIGKSSRIFN